MDSQSRRRGFSARFNFSLKGTNLAAAFDVAAAGSSDIAGSGASEEPFRDWEFQCSVDGSCSFAGSCASEDTFHGREMKISAEFTVNSETEYPIDGHLVYATKYLDSNSKGPKKSVKIPLKTIFSLVLKSLGIAQPAFAVLETNGSYQVKIKFEPRLPPTRFPCPAVAQLAGDVSHDYVLAEESAIMNAFQYLDKMYNVVVVDLSTLKVGRLKISSNKYAKLVPLNNSIQSLLHEWSDSVSLLYRIKSCPESSDPNNKTYLRSMLDLLLPICSLSDDFIRSFDRKLKKLQAKWQAKKDSLDEKYRSSLRIGSKSFVRNGYLHEVDILCILLEKLHLPQPDYIPDADDGLFLGALKLFLPDPNDKDMVHSYILQARYLCDNLDDANNLAAQEAILFLEKNMNIEIVDFNYSKKVAADEELEFYKDLSDDFIFLGAAVQNTWEDMLAKLNDCVGLARQSATCGPLLHVMETALSQCYVDLEAAVQKYRTIRV